jgi:hypothetical protein
MANSLAWAAAAAIFIAEGWAELPRGLPEDLPSKKPGLDADRGKLVDRRFRNHAAIGEEENPVVAVFRPRHLHNHGTGDHRSMRQRLHQLKKRPEKRRCVRTHAADQSVGKPELKHHRREVVRRGEQTPQVARLNALIALQLRRQRQKTRHLGGCLGIDDRNPL